MALIGRAVNMLAFQRSIDGIFVLDGDDAKHLARLAVRQGHILTEDDAAGGVLIAR
ncbi:hypothetical protein MnTg02_02743 [bacterium MnTg02]|nr:hypothetical protein MnTg02_02743 [bacterium MnTg02]